MFRVIPAIDISKGQAVRLKQGDFNEKTVYFDDPMDAARFYQENGATMLHVVDLDASKEGRFIHLDKILEMKTLGLAIEYGGGIRSYEMAEELLRKGIDRIVVGTLATRDKTALLKLLSRYRNRVVVSLDVKDGRVMTEGWLTDANLPLERALEECTSYGAYRVLITDISKDGMLAGPNLTLYKELKANYPLSLIASGGVKDLGDLIALKKAGIPEVVVGKAFYEGTLDIKEALSC